MDRDLILFYSKNPTFREVAFRGIGLLNLDPEKHLVFAVDDLDEGAYLYRKQMPRWVLLDGKFPFALVALRGLRAHASGHTPTVLWCEPGDELSEQTRRTLSEFSAVHIEFPLDPTDLALALDAAKITIDG